MSYYKNKNSNGGMYEEDKSQYYHNQTIKRIKGIVKAFSKINGRGIILGVNGEVYEFDLRKDVVQGTDLKIEGVIRFRPKLRRDPNLLPFANHISKYYPNREELEKIKRQHPELKPIGKKIEIDESNLECMKGGTNGTK